MITIGIIFLIIVAMIYIMVKRSLEMKKLATEGEDIIGTIIKKYKTGKKTKRKHIKYEYTTPTGKVMTRSSAVTDSVWDRYNLNDQIELVYLPKQPEVFGPKYLVDQAKQALSTISN